MSGARSSLLPLTALIAGLSLLPAVVGRGADGASGKSSREEPKRPSVAIPSAEVVQRAIEVSNRLRALDAVSSVGSDMETIQESLPEVIARIDREIEAIVEIGEDGPRMSAMVTQEQRWRRRQARLAGWLASLTAAAGRIESTVERLTELRNTWTTTGDSLRKSPASAPILAEVDKTLGAIDAAQITAEERRAVVLDLQVRVAHQESRCADALALIARAEQAAAAGTLIRESPPIWDASLWTRPLASEGKRVRRIASAHLQDVREYLCDPAAGMPLHVAIFLAVAVLFCAVRRRMRQWGEDGTEISPSMKVFDRPFTAALAVVLVIATSVLSPVPTELRNAFRIAGIFVTIRFSLPLIPPLLRRAAWVFGILATVEIARQTSAGTDWIERGILAFESIAGAACVGWGLSFGRVGRLRSPDETWVGHRLLRFAGVAALMLFASGLIANMLGYVPLARLMTPASVVLGGVAIALYAAYLLASGVVSLALRVRPLRLLHMVSHHRDLLERRICRALGWFFILAWLARSLEFLGLWKPLSAMGRSLLALEIDRGSIRISVEEVLAFVLALVVAYLLSKFLRFTLEEDVHPRTGITPGLSYAISTLLHYAILTAGFVVGLGLLGVNLTNVTVLVSAFGVGIGFGLQSVVNNFASGLILLLERPVHAGDTVEFGGLSGKIRRIGIRSTVIRTPEGADTIVPNSMLVSEKVSNWTLNDRLRRIRLPVGVDYRSCPDQVIRLLVKVANTHPCVLQAPAPRALLMSFGDSSINYELQVWTDRFDVWSQTQSELASAVFSAVQDAGMSFPFPQREIRILHDSCGQAEESASVVHSLRSGRHPRAASSDQGMGGDGPRDAHV